MSQVGNGSSAGVKTENAPKFDDYIVNQDTWKPKDVTQFVRTDDASNGGIPHNYTPYAEGTEFTCDLTIKAGSEELRPLQVLSESSPGTRKFLVLPGFGKEGYGGKPLKHTGVTLAVHVGFTPTVIEVEV